MRNYLSTGFLSVVVFAVFALPPAMSGEPLVPIRSWQFHKLDADYVSRAMKQAGRYNINTVVFSHGMIEDVSQLYEGSERAERLRKLAAEAHALKLRVWIWVHELENDVPKRYLSGGAVEIDRDGFWQWLQGKYEKLFADFPEFDGILLTFHETKYKIFQESSVRSKLTMPQRFARLINTIDTACAKHEKDFVVRSFLYEPQELQWFAEGLADASPRVMLQCKCVPHDWQPFYPHNPMIGKFPDRKLIVEFDCSSEFTGRNRIPYTSAEYFEYRWRYALSRPGIVGYNARLDHAGYDALFTPNEVNIYTLYRLTEDGDITAREIWRQWSEQRYGEDAAEFVEQALRRSFETVNKSYFVLEFWITNHSKLPSFGYADGHITSRTIAKWRPDEPKYAELEERLKHPDAKLLEEILAEKDQAIALADEALFFLSQAKPFLSAEQYDDLYRRLNLLRRVATVWKLHAEAFFGYKILAEGHEVDGLKERAARAIEGLRYQAKASEKAGLTSDPPAADGEIRNVADELAGKLKKLKK
ncbi:MAG: hypothetical protein JXN61_18320 [Sedimentisphaerales bacterium]|nr:hypothetical protein [Sedimentisphaerales bacterium]